MCWENIIGSWQKHLSCLMIDTPTHSLLFGGVDIMFKILMLTKYHSLVQWWNGTWVCQRFSMAWNLRREWLKGMKLALGNSNENTRRKLTLPSEHFSRAHTGINISESHYGRWYYDAVTRKREHLTCSCFRNQKPRIIHAYVRQNVKCHYSHSFFFFLLFLIDFSCFKLKLFSKLLNLKKCQSSHFRMHTSLFEFLMYFLVDRKYVSGGSNSRQVCWKLSLLPWKTIPNEGTFYCRVLSPSWDDVVLRVHDLCKLMMQMSMTSESKEKWEKVLKEMSKDVHIKQFSETFIISFFQ